MEFKKQDMDKLDFNVDEQVDALKLKRRNSKFKGNAINSSYLRKIKNQTKVLNKQKMSYTLKVGGSTYELKSVLFKGRAFSRSNLKNYDLQFIKKVKRHVLKNNIHLNFLDQYFPSDVAYMDVNPTLQHQKFEKVVEIDVNEAYWKTAYMMGVINEEIYEEGKKGNLGKYTRLVALGALAKQEMEYVYIDGVFSHVNEIKSDLTENVWYSICKRLSDVMQGAKKILGNDYLFYWVDGIYFIDSKINRKKIKNHFLKFGYTSKDVETFLVGFGDKWFAVYDEDYKVKKEFSYAGIINRKISFEDSLKLSKLCKKLLKDNLDLDLLLKDK